MMTYYSDKFEQAKGNINQTWQTIKDLIKGPESANKESIVEIKADTNVVTEKRTLLFDLTNFLQTLVQT